MNTFPTANVVRGLALAIILSGTAPGARAALGIGDTLPDLPGFKLEGKLPGPLKGKVVLLDFWASWCGPCAESFPVMEELHHRYKDRGLVIIAVSADEKAAPMQAFLKKHTVSFAVVRDAEQKLVAAADVKAMPTSFIIDQGGKVRFVHSGFHGTETRKQYATEIESVLKGAP